MKPAQRVLSYYGSKYRLGRYYPAPTHDVIIEAFAGGAGYALHHYNKQIHLYDLNPKVVGVWDYVIKANPDEIRALPLLEPDQRVIDLKIHDEAKWLIGWWVNTASPTPLQTLNPWAIKQQSNDPSSTWTPIRREYIAQTSAQIKHWKVTCASYQEIPNMKATWFIDPPYECRAGRRYPFHKIEFDHLAEWCKSRNGQVMVCENNNSKRWLPFQPFRDCLGTTKENGTCRRTQEVVWYSGSEVSQVSLF
jgi:site-specific DNA-adenine methylase